MVQYSESAGKIPLERSIWIPLAVAQHCHTQSELTWLQVHRDCPVLPSWGDFCWSLRVRLENVLSTTQVILLSRSSNHTGSDGVVRLNKLQLRQFRLWVCYWSSSVAAAAWWGETAGQSKWRNRDCNGTRESRQAGLLSGRGCEAS